jgi:hypothetical protein
MSALLLKIPPADRAGGSMQALIEARIDAGDEPDPAPTLIYITPQGSSYRHARESGHPASG